MADNNTIARPYAEAVFEVARESGALAEVSDALATAGALFEDGRVAEFLGNPRLSDDERYAFLTGLFDAAGASLFAGDNMHGKNFLKLLIEYDRIDVLPEISVAFDELKAEVENTVDVIVTSAKPIDTAKLAGISKALASRLGREVNLDTAVDENLIGGAVIKAGDVVIDGSLRARLDGLSNALTK